LEVKPWTDQEANADRDDVAPEVKVVGRKKARRVYASEIRRAEFRNNYRHTADNQGKESGVAILNPSDGELLSEENARSQNDQRCEWKVEGIRTESERLPTISYQGEKSE
jgi:hypothetical protein